MNFTFRNVTEDDYLYIISNLDAWWGGRQMSDMLPKLFFKLFNDTSFVALDGTRIAGFLIGLQSQVNPREGYVHFIGIDPEYRKMKLGETLYSMFFRKAGERGITYVSCVTSPLNRNSVAFHQKIGFRIIKGDETTDDNISYFKDYDKPGEDRVLFRYEL
jgi:ribosomal protein S18 acetylase RimI-like enzyme